jgi:hypothetical protein
MLGILQSEYPAKVEPSQAAIAFTQFMVAPAGVFSHIKLVPLSVMVPSPLSVKLRSDVGLMYAALSKAA